METLCASALCDDFEHALKLSKYPIMKFAAHVGTVGPNLSDGIGCPKELLDYLRSSLAVVDAG